MLLLIEVRQGDSEGLNLEQARTSRRRSVGKHAHVAQRIFLMPGMNLKLLSYWSLTGSSVKQHCVTVQVGSLTGVWI